jgi:hypothetical protein
MSYSDTIKAWFVRGAKPVAAQFASWIDMSRLKDDPVPLADVAGLTAALLAKAEQSVIASLLARMLPDMPIKLLDFSYIIPANIMLESVAFKSTVSGVLSIGTTVGGNDLYDSYAYAAGVMVLPITLNSLSDIDRTIYFTGITASTQFFIYKR